MHEIECDQEEFKILIVELREIKFFWKMGSKWKVGINYVTSGNLINFENAAGYVKWIWSGAGGKS